MSKKTVTVVCNLPKGSGITLRVPPAELAMDSRSGERPEDLDLRHGINTGVSAAAVDYWSQRLNGDFRFRKSGDHVIVTADDAVTTHVDDSEPAPAAASGYWTPERIAYERASIERERQSIERMKARNARDRAAALAPRAADARTVKKVQRALATINSIFK